MSEVTIYHNPRCSKSRQTLQLLRERSIEPRIIEYLKTPPDADTLDAILEQLQLNAHDITRKGEAQYAELGLKQQLPDESRMRELLREHPILIERPIVVTKRGATIGRPPENVLKLL